MPRKMKDSGVEWIGEIPEDWEVVSMRYLSSLTTGNKDTIDAELNGGYPFFVRSKTIRRINTYSYEGEGILTAGDGNIGEIFHYINGKFDFHQRVYLFYNFNNISGRLLYYYLKSNLKKHISLYNAKTTVDSLRLPWLKEFPVVLPPRNQQNSIANFLDKKTSLIDNAIEKSKQSIEEYKKYKQSLITETVTKGLDPDVEMKDSGIEWIGEIPRHWEIMRLKDLGHVYRGSADKVIKDDEIPVKLVQYTDIYYNRELRYGYDKFLDITVTPSEYRMAKVQKGDLLMTTSSEVIDDIGRACVLVDSFDKHVIGSDTLKVTILDEVMDINFRKYLTENGIYLQKFATMSRGITRYRFNMADFKCLRYQIPPIEEQKEIANFLDTKCKEIDKLINQKERLIKELESYKKSLIYEYVTGKKQVD